MRLRRETPSDVPGVAAVLAAAFAEPQPPETGAGETPLPPEVGLVEALRSSDAWLPHLSVVALDDTGTVVGQALGTRGFVDGRPAVAVGPVGVLPERQGRGVGSALMQWLLGAADAAGEPLAACLGDPAYYGRFGFVDSHVHGVQPPVESWQPHFMVRTLAAYDESLRGVFAYAPPFMDAS